MAYQCTMSHRHTPSCVNLIDFASRDDPTEDRNYADIPLVVLRAYAKTQAEGDTKYGRWNWKKGFPTNQLFNHAIEHLFAWSNGDGDDEELAHALWNIGTLIYQESQNASDAD